VGSGVISFIFLGGSGRCAGSARTANRRGSIPLRFALSAISYQPFWSCWKLIA